MSKIRVCNTAEIPSNGMKDYDIEGGLKVLIANAGDSYYAYQGICPHQEVCLAEGYYDGAVLTCHQHLWQWDITTGKEIGLAEAPLEKYEVQVEDGEIFVVQSSALKVAQLFMDVSDATLQKLDQLARREKYESGSTLYNIGDPTDDLYILESGRVEFLIGRDGTSPAGFVLRKGEVSAGRRYSRINRGALQNPPAGRFGPVAAEWRGSLESPRIRSGIRVFRHAQTFDADHSASGLSRRKIAQVH